MRFLSIFLVLLVLGACSSNSTFPNKFGDPALVHIHELKDRRATDSLMLFLRANDPIYRREAALALGSVQDTAASPLLGTILLEDPDADVRRNAAFALGQTGRFQAINALLPALQDTSHQVVREVLEALGKSVEQFDLPALVNFQPADTLEQEGQAWGFYHLALRKKTDSLITKNVSSLLKSSNSYATRLAAANYFSRSSNLAGKSYQINLLRAAAEDVRPEVRMAAVSGFRNLSAKEALPAIARLLSSEKDYRVRVNAVRVCQNFLADETKEIIFGAVEDTTNSVSVAASEVIRNQGNGQLSALYLAALPRVKSTRAKANLYAGLLKTVPSDSLLRELNSLYRSAPVYFKAELLSALGETKAPYNRQACEFLSQELLSAANEKVIRTSAASAITSLHHQANKSIPTKDFLTVYLQGIAQGDVAVIGILASALMDESLNCRAEVKDLNFLYEAKSKLKLPQDIESLQPLEKAIAYLEGKAAPTILKNEFNHPIDWGFVKSIPATQRVQITTTKGTMILRLGVEEAPGSVANFVDLVNKKYFDGKFFHRVVPNFVIQTGCNRGDGYGSENYSIRSEFSLRRYTTGSVGMASAGKDTEGTQWFVTHCPTPHLDGKYSIVGETENGQEVADRMDVGDRILNVVLLKE
jgi:cyclophilin family peptidyl-prolyl cis-trans isomerase/HEAT repeat protein